MIEFILIANDLINFAYVASIKTQKNDVWGFPGDSASKEFACKAGDLGFLPWLGRSPGGKHGNPFQYSCTENPLGQRELVGYSSWGRKESETTEQLSTAQHVLFQKPR